MYEEALAIRREEGDELATAEALYNLSFSYTWVSLSDSSASPDPEAALRLLDEARTLLKRLGDRGGLARTLWGIATSEFWSGRLDDAKAHVGLAMQHSRDLGDAFLTAWVLYLDGLISLGLGELDRVRPSLEEGLRMFTESNDISAYTLVLDAFAALALRSGDRAGGANLRSSCRARGAEWHWAQPGQPRSHWVRSTGAGGIAEPPGPAVGRRS